ncbi:uncharacterized protein KY384_006573 [Bacidia gigantensis]|uniref:uncharacterized protein n=1 Tax=Bacidia gigantensis TaxID=2732470 RepID=UPI001D03632B|nr:uncharacterized protein KY384_006573 [Bacidia gigantensis]KAG8528884.1 hypothetical protein KY384_006573 [Bacidia gigantensis]
MQQTYKTQHTAHGTPMENSDQVSNVDPVETDEDSTSTFLHSSCGKCKHFNRYIPFKIPQDGSKHERFYCEKCTYPIVGFGRTSTQTTLASADSLSLNEYGRPRPPRIRICTNKDDLESRPALMGKSLTPLSERSPTSRLDHSPILPSDEENSKARDKDSVLVPGSKPAQSNVNEEPVNSSSMKTTPPRLTHLQNLGVRLKARFERGSNRLKLLARRRPRSQLREKEEYRPAPQSERNEHQHSVTMSPSSRLSFASQPCGVSRASSIPMKQRVESANSDRNPSLAHAAGPDRTEISEATKRDQACQPSEKTQIYERRRRRTLESNLLWHRVCKCDDQCQCKYNDSQHPTTGRLADHSAAPTGAEALSSEHRHDLDTETHQDSNEVLPMPLFLLTSHMNHHLPINQQPPELHRISLAGDSERVVTDLSQATTRLGSENAESLSTDTDGGMFASRPPSSGTQQSMSNVRNNAGIDHILDGVGFAGHVEQGQPATSPLPHSITAPGPYDDTLPTHRQDIENNGAPIGLHQYSGTIHPPRRQGDLGANGHLDTHDAMTTLGISDEASEEVTPTTTIRRTTERGLSGLSTPLEHVELSRRLSELDGAEAVLEDGEG